MKRQRQKTVEECKEIETMTTEEVDQIVAEQMQCLPKWWSKSGENRNSIMFHGQVPMPRDGLPVVVKRGMTSGTRRKPRTQEGRT